MPVKFTTNKQVVRDLQCETIRKRLSHRLAYLRYFGLTSPDMKDARDWAALFEVFQVVERGREGEEWVDQHSLLLTAALYGLSRKVSLLRGDIDSVILAGQDAFGTAIDYPFDVVSLDYSGGFLYADEQGALPRLAAIQRVIEDQSAHQQNFLLFVSIRIANPVNGEVTRTIENIRTELIRYGASADKVCDVILAHVKDEARFKVYLPFFVNQVAARAHMTCETEKTIIYQGNRGARMMNFRFFLKPDQKTVAPRFPQERLVQVLNAPLIQIQNGKIEETTLGVPKLRQAKP